MIDISKIKEKILKEAEEEKRKILVQAEEEVKRLEKETEEEIKRLEKEEIQLIEKYLEELKKRELSKLKKEENIKILNAKWKIIDNLFDLLIEELKKDPRYSELLKEKIKNKDYKEIIISQNDLSLFPSLFENLRIPIIKNNEIKGGIILKKEKEELDFSLDTLLNEIKKKYLKEINQLLFT